MEGRLQVEHPSQVQIQGVGSERPLVRDGQIGLGCRGIVPYGGRVLECIAVYRLAKKAHTGARLIVNRRPLRGVFVQSLKRGSTAKLLSAMLLDEIVHILAEYFDDIRLNRGQDMNRSDSTVCELDHFLSMRLESMGAVLGKGGWVIPAMIVNDAIRDLQVPLAGILLLLGIELERTSRHLCTRLAFLRLVDLGVGFGGVRPALRATESG